VSQEIQEIFMNHINRFFLATLSAALLLTSAAPAMEIQEFDKMAIQDHGDYIQALVDGAQKVLNDQGRRDLATKVDKLFTEVHQGNPGPGSAMRYNSIRAKRR